MKKEKEFEKAVGIKPEDDDIERVNCELAGTPGHYSCGWCLKHNKPRFVCGCIHISERVIK